MSKKYVFFFGEGMAEGRAAMKDLLGGKGGNLAEMTLLSIPVPPGFTITTEVCTYYYQNRNQYPPELQEQVEEALKKIEKIMGVSFGSRENPLLLSIRSGARVSMPGMMDTVLNLGINDQTIQGLIEQSKDPRFCYDSFRRFIQMYGNVVMGIPSEHFEETLTRKKKAKGITLDTQLSAEDLKELMSKYKEVVKRVTGKDFPTNPRQQLWEAITAVFRSWDNKRAQTYRRLHNIPDHWGTAVNVQAMVFGNMGDDCATGVAFTRDPATGEKKFYGEYLVNAQGEDVVAGIRTPQPIDKASKSRPDQVSLEEIMPVAYEELVQAYKKLEKHFKDMQDLEFTIQKRKLWLLQTRTGKRTASAAVKIAIDMVHEGLIDKKTALTRVMPSQLDKLLHPIFDPKAEKKPIARGLPASPGAARGRVVFYAHDAELMAQSGKKVILVRSETSAEDIGGMNAAEGILTAHGGMTSHAAVVARGMGKCCVVGCGDISIDYKAKHFTVNNVVVKEGDPISIDGTTGEVMLGEVETILPELTGDFGTLMSWADEIRRLKIRTNADTPKDARTARKFGAEGIGLCRTEHMFFGRDRIKVMREMIMADSPEERQKALYKLLPLQRDDFKTILEVMQGLPVTIRLFDPPLHEFIPQEEGLLTELAKDMGISLEKLKTKALSLKEMNPMLGLRGCRLGITYPEIYKTQARAIFEASCILSKEGIKVFPEVMIPLVGEKRELQGLRQEIEEVARQVMQEMGCQLSYLIGTMIELPRACLVADEIAQEAEFFSFGTNDLTQMTYGFSRDDIGSFLPTYLERKILDFDPFQSIDTEGVGQLMAMAVEKGRKVKPKLKIGICGEHGGEPASIEFCHSIGLDYVSCSPYRVPGARLAAAHSVLAEERGQRAFEPVGE